ncbi:uncharacterized protein VTP21DRAFT_7763 [Calcarisporiella thermophila]|uniref:uncharacterized protein n=1 Tax=Calcarisporiella thermophila TaxID=911321 RepID=UPI003741EB9F
MYRFLFPFINRAHPSLPIRALSKQLLPAVSALPVQHLPHVSGFRSAFHSLSNATRVDDISSQISTSASKLQIQWNNEQASLFHHFWLRDHCRCPECYHQVTKQRLVDTFKIPRNIQPSSVTSNKDGIEVIWSNDGHKSFYQWDWLRRHSYDPPLEKEKQVLEKTIFWDAKIAENPPTVDYKSVMSSNEGLAQWLENIVIYGFSFVDGVPATLKDTEDLARRICFIRETHYGGSWEVTANMEHGDTAYTNLPLKAHTDNTYFTDPCGLQMFHILEFNGTGGDSLLVDGFHAAQQLKRSNPEAYHTLSTTPIPAHSAGDPDTCIVPTPRALPILRHAGSELYQIRYNNDDRSSISHLSSHQIERFYEALFAWDRVLRNPENEFWFPLRPGRAVIFDNWRVLHGRAGFTGMRKLSGAYLNWDDFRSRWRRLKYSPQDIEQEFL